MGLLDDFANALPDFLPDDPQKREAARMGLLNFGAQMLQHANQGFGGALGYGLQGGAEGYKTAYDDTTKQRLQNAQLKMLQNKDAREQRQIQLGLKMLGVDDVDGSAAPPAASTPISGGVLGTTPTSTAAQAGGFTPVDGQPAPAFQRLLQPSWLPQAQTSPGLSPVAAAPVPQQAPQRPRGLRGLTPDQVVGFQLMGGPDLLPALKYANEGTAFQQGTTYRDPYTGQERSYAKLENGQVQNPDGSVQLAPGYVKSLETAEEAKSGAQERGKAPYSFQTLPLASGPRTMTTKQAAAYVGGQGGAPSFQGADQFSMLPQALQKRIIEDARKSGDPKASFSYQYPDGRMVKGDVDFSQAVQSAPGVALLSDVDKKRQTGAVDVSQDVAKNSLERLYKEADAQQDIVNKLNIMEREVKKGIYGNNPLDRTAMAAHANGMNNSDKAVRTARVRQLGEALITAKGLGANISNTDAARYEAASGRLNNPVSQKDAEEAIAIMREIATNAIKSTQGRVQQFKKTGEMADPQMPPAAKKHYNPATGRIE